MRRFLLLAAALLGIVSGAQAQTPSQAPTLTTAQKLLLLSGRPRVFALDGQPAAFAAYSARRLLRPYAGALLRLRRASDSTEQDFFPTGGGDFPTAAAGSFCAATTCFISKWYDQSGNGRDALQTTAANQPQFVMSRSTLNNRPAALFGDASAFELDTASIAASVFGGGGFYSGVIDFTTTPTIADRFFAHGTGINLAFNMTAPSFQLTVAASVSGGTWVGSAAVALGAHAVDFLYSSAAIANVPTITVDGSVRAVTATQPTGTITAESGALNIGNVGGTRGFPGYMAENLFFASQPSGSQIAALRANQKAYWGTP